MNKTSARLFIALQLVIFLSGLCAALAQTNELTQLLTTNREGIYDLKPVWVGKSTQTFGLGYYVAPTNRSPEDIAHDNLYFDIFDYSEAEAGLPPKSRRIGERDKEHGQNVYGNLHLLCESFPTDAQLTQTLTLNSLTNLLRSSHSPRTVRRGVLYLMYSDASWRYFRFKDDVTLETLSVDCLTFYTNSLVPVEHIQSLLIRRGTASRARQ